MVGKNRTSRFSSWKMVRISYLKIMKLYYLKFKMNKQNGRKENIRATSSN